MEYRHLKRKLSSASTYIRLTLCLFCILSALIASARDFVITLDAGHGGHDYGALGKTTNEKTITLSVVKQLGKLIEKNLSDVKVIYTRDTDVFIPLAERAEISNHAGSDLFMSVHINSVDKRNRNRTSIEGCQVYTLGLHKTDENLEVAKRENSVMELEDDPTAKYAGFDPNSLESDIIFELSQSKRLDQSIEFADEIHRQLVNISGRAPKGVRQAGFWVLWATSAPAVLVELDFICNPRSEKYLASETGQEEMVAALYNAFCAYLNTYGSGITGRRLPEAKPITLKSDRKQHKDNLLTTAREKATSPLQSGAAHEIAPVKKSKETQFYVQLLASATPLSPGAKEFKGFESLEVYSENGWYKYVLGPAETLDDAKRLLEEARNSFPESFIIKMKNGERTGMIKP